MNALAMLAVVVLAATAPAAADPLAGMHDLTGSWKCTYRAGATSFAYDATYAYDLDGRLLRQIDSWPGGGAEELLAYDAQHARWKAVVFDNTGTATILRATGTDPHHIAYVSVYPDASIATTYVHVSPTEYRLDGMVRAGGKTTTSVDTCVRRSP